MFEARFDFIQRRWHPNGRGKVFHNFGAEQELYLGTYNVPFVKVKAILHWS